MGVLNIIFAIVLILTSVGVIALVSMQESKRGMSALTGGQSEAVGRNYGRTRDAMLVKGTKVLTAVLFVLLHNRPQKIQKTNSKTDGKFPVRFLLCAVCRLGSLAMDF